MNIDVVRIHFKDNYGDDKYSYKYLPFQYCCEYLKNKAFTLKSTESQRKTSRM